MTNEERARLQVTVDGYASMSKAGWGIWLLAVLWQIWRLAEGSGRIADITLAMVAVVLPIGIAGFGRSAAAAKAVDLNDNVVAGISDAVSSIEGDRLELGGVTFAVPPRIAAVLNEGDTVAVEFAPHSRMVLQIHRLNDPNKALTAASETVTTD
jgi:hypothetical protein